MSFALTPLLDSSVFASGIISTFLHVHPFGASIEYICSYLQRLDTKVTGTHDSELPPWNGVAEPSFSISVDDTHTDNVGGPTVLTTELVACQGQAVSLETVSVLALILNAFTAFPIEIKVKQRHFKGTV